MKKLSEHIIWLRPILLLLIVNVFSPPILAQVRGEVVGMDQPNQFKIILTPEQSWSLTNSITNTATITIKVPTGNFQLSTIRSYTGIWEVSDPIIAPIESPNYDYYIFHLSSPLTSIVYEAGVSLDLFSFINAGACTSDVQIIDEVNDPFLPPNSINANVGNYFTILGHGASNAYAGSIRSTHLNSCNKLEFEVELSDRTCSDDPIKARVHYLNGTPPMRFVLKKENAISAYIDTLTEVGKVWDAPSNLEEGDYILYMTDIVDTILHKFTIDEIVPLEVVVVYNEVITCNDKDGAVVQLLPKGIQSDESYSLQWSSGHTTKVVEGLDVGPYQVTLTNGLGCTTRTAFEVDGIPPIEIEVQETIHPSCPEKEDGSITVDVQGGVGVQYFYEWSDPNLKKKWLADNLKGGEHTLSVYDISGCVGTAMIELDIPPPIEPVIQIFDPTCPEFTDGAISLEANREGALPFSYSLNNAPSRSHTDYRDLAAGEYDLLITDARNCSKLEKLFLEEPEEFEIELGEDQTFLIGESKTLSLEEELDEASYDFDWYPSESLDCVDCPDPTATPHQTTTYSVVVTNEKGCSRQDEVTVNINLDRPVFFPTAFSPNGDGNNDFFEIPPGKTTSEVVRLQMFNRWGQLLYDSNLVGGNIKWDGHFEGKPLNKGVYIFEAEILFNDGEVLTYHGDVLLLR